MIRVLLIRHGRTAWNVGNGPGQRFRGVVDLPLATEGVAQAQATARRLAAAPLTAVYSSPLQRAAHTARIIAQPHSVKVEVRSGLRTMDYGDWAGKTFAEVAEQWPDLFARWRHDPFSVQVPGGESAHLLRERAVAAVHEIVAAHRDGDTVAIVSHQAVTKTLVCGLADLANPAYWRVRQDLCNLSRFDYLSAGGSPVLVGLNDICHRTQALPQAVGEGVRIVLVRHGQTAWNAGAGPERFRGRMDLPLDNVGRQQAHAVARRLANEPIADIYASPLLRTQQTAAPLARALGLPVQPHRGLLDIDYGHVQGLTHAEAATAYPELVARWRMSPSQASFPGGEGLTAVQSRLLRLLDELVTRHPGQTVVLFGHQIVNKVLACTLLDVDLSDRPVRHELDRSLDRIWRLRQDTTGVSVFQQIGGAWQTLCLNDVCHWGTQRPTV
ncbi:MAG: histidine phosphatase family protein [Anaerolineae bacterium]